MKTIVIDEKTVSIDGVKYTREEPKFKVGQWVLCKMTSGIEINRIIAIHHDHLEYDNKYGSTHCHYSYDKYVRLATKNEIEEHLIKVAKEKGFSGKIDLKLKRVNIHCAEYVRGHTNPDWKYVEEFDRLQLNGTGIYQEGKWAEILPEKKKLPKTKGGIGALIQLYHEQNDGLPFKTPVDEFLSNYED